MIYNTLAKKKMPFEPLEPGKVKMYVCGPTTYNYIHLGNARPIVVFDTVRRYFSYLGYDVTFVSNFTDVDDKIINRANEEGKDPVALAAYYIDAFFEDTKALNVLPATVHPKVSEHIDDIIAFVQGLIDKGYAYALDNGDVYYSVRKFADYGQLSGRDINDLLSGARVEVDEKKQDPLDFALWKSAKPGEPYWESPWGKGRPGWHIECSAMSAKYLGDTFDIHGGGMDLMFPHHECEIAQSTAALGHDSAKYWIHNNMITINGQKMGKSLGNFITLEELFTGNHKLLTQAYSPMTIRFFVLQAHYRSTLDFSNEALQAAEKGLDRLMKAVEALDKIKPSEQSTVDPAELETRCREALDDDLNSPMAISALFDWVRIINQLVEGQQRITAADLEKLREIVRRYVFDILGLRDEKAASAGGKDLVTPLVNMLLDLRQTAKTEKNWALSDKIRDELTAIGIRVKDRKDGCDWEIE